jgi:hypothetical protein
VQVGGLTEVKSATPPSGIGGLGATGVEVGVVRPKPRIMPIPAILFIGLREFPRFRIDSTIAGFAEGAAGG